MTLYYNPDRKYCIAVLGYAQNLGYLNNCFSAIKRMAGVKLKRASDVTVRYITDSNRYKHMFVMEFPQETCPSGE